MPFYPPSGPIKKEDEAKWSAQLSGMLAAPIGAARITATSVIPKGEVWKWAKEQAKSGRDPIQDEIVRTRIELQKAGDDVPEWRIEELRQRLLDLEKKLHEGNDTLFDKGSDLGKGIQRGFWDLMDKIGVPKELQKAKRFGSTTKRVMRGDAVGKALEGEENE